MVPPTCRPGSGCTARNSSCSRGESGSRVNRRATRHREPPRSGCPFVRLSAVGVPSYVIRTRAAVGVPQCTVPPSWAEARLLRLGWDVVPPIPSLRLLPSCSGPGGDRRVTRPAQGAPNPGHRPRIREKPDRGFFAPSTRRLPAGTSVQARPSVPRKHAPGLPLPVEAARVTRCAIPPR